MRPWTVFNWVRRITLSLAAIFGLIWSIFLSVYLSKAWSHSTSPQRAIILTIICVYGFSSVLLYLMVVVVFRIWKELWRMIFLLALHISPAVFFTIHRSGFSCAPFDKQRTCDLAQLVTLCVVWAISGILLVYTIYLCIMSRVPRPSPLITPNLLIGSAPSLSHTHSRAPSMSSVKSVTGLLSQVPIQPYSLPLGSPASYSPSIQSQGSSVPRTIPKKLFIVTTDTASVSSDALPRARREQPLRRGVSYGAMGSPAHPRPVDRPSIPGTTSVYSGSSVVAPPASAVVAVAASTRSPSARPPVRRKPVNKGNAPDASQRSPPSLLNVNPFKDAPSRNPSPESFYSQISMRSAPANLDMGGGPYTPFSRPYGGYLTPYFSYNSSGSLVSIPPQLHPCKPPANRLSNPSMPYMASSQSSNVSYPGTPSSTPTLTARNASVHSLVPSLHLADPHTPPDVPVDVAPRAPSPHAFTAPPAAYMRTGSGDPLRGPRNARLPASGRVHRVPYGGDVRRYGTVQGTRSGNESPGMGYGYGAPGHRYCAGGVGHSHAGQAQSGAPPMYMYIGRMAQANDVGGANDAPWREMVMRAAHN